MYWQTTSVNPVGKFVLASDAMSCVQKFCLPNERLRYFPVLDVIWILNALISFQLFIYRFFANASLQMNICKCLFIFLAL